MSLQELEKKVRDLDQTDLVHFSEWFDAYRETHAPRSSEEAQLSQEQRAEIDRRLDALDADPSLSVPWEGTMEEVRRLRGKLRAEKAADRRA